MKECPYCKDEYPKMILHYCDGLINRALDRGWDHVHVNEHGVLIGKPPPWESEFSPVTNETVEAEGMKAYMNSAPEFYKKI